MSAGSQLMEASAMLPTSLESDATIPMQLLVWSGCGRRRAQGQLSSGGYRLGTVSPRDAARWARAILGRSDRNQGASSAVAVTGRPCGR